MKAPNHVVGGFVFTGVVGALVGINIVEDWRYIALTVLFSLLPDIDHSKSWIGRCVFPLAKWINRKYGHRTITHGLPCMLLLWFIIRMIQNVWFPSIPVSTLFLLGYSSHLIFDMMTIQGVPLFYPFKTNPCVIPAKRSMRISTNNLRQESVVMCSFILVGLFMYPMMKTGFWTQYNSFFGTVKHLYSEYSKSDDLLLVDYEIQQGSDLLLGQGYLVESSESSFTLFEDGSIITYPVSANQIIKKVIPTHTGKEFHYRSKEFVDWSSDSVNAFVGSTQYVTEIQIHSLFDFQADGQITKKLNTTNPVQIAELNKTKPNYTRSTMRTELAKQVKNLKSSRSLAKRKYANDLSSYEAAYNEYSTYEGAAEKEINQHKLRQLKEPIYIDKYSDKISDLEYRIAEIRQRDHDEYELKLATYRERQTFTGFVKYIEIIDSQLATL